MTRVSDIRRHFADLFVENKFVSLSREKSMTDIVGNRTLEITGASFVADEETVFGEVNRDYVKRELEWYESMSLNVNDIPGETPRVWKSVADSDGYVNSNYGWCVFSIENCSQYENVIRELSQNPMSRRGSMIYTRPTMWEDYDWNGRSDFMCTYGVDYFVRDGEAHAIVHMRSNDLVFGYRNDWHWQRHMLERVARDLSVTPGTIRWQVSNLHLYEKDFYLVDHFVKTGSHSISKSEYRRLYQESPFGGKN